MSQSDVIEASARIVRAIQLGTRSPECPYADVKSVVRPFEQPAVFWGKWFKTPGLREQGNKLAPIMLESVEDMSVVLIDRVISPPLYLIDGVERARQAGATVIIVITHRLQYTEADLDRLAELAEGVLVRIMLTHRWVGYEERAAKLCPGVFQTLQHVA